MKKCILFLLLLFKGGMMISQNKFVTLYGERIAFDKTAIGLGNVDNTSDINKPISTSQNNALNLKANIESPTLSGVPTTPAPSVNDNSKQIATTAFVLSSSSENRNIYQASSNPPILMGTKGDIYIQTDGTDLVVWYKIETSPTVYIWVKKS